MFVPPPPKLKNVGSPLENRKTPLLDVKCCGVRLYDEWQPQDSCQTLVS